MAFTRCTAVGARTVGKTITRSEQGVQIAGRPNVAKWTAWELEDWPDLDTALERIKAIGAAGNQILVPGRLKDGLDPDGLHIRRKRGEEATLDEVPVTWVCVDLDGVTVDESDDESMLIQAVTENLPEQFHDVGFVWQWTSSYCIGTPRSDIRAHLFFPLSEPTTLLSIKTLLKDRPGVDGSIYHGAAVIYLAEPTFRNYPDPVPQRYGVSYGLADAVAPIPHVEPSEAPEIVLPEGFEAESADVQQAVARAEMLFERNGSRHHALTDLVANLKAFGCSHDQIFAVCDEWMNTHGRECQPREIENLIDAELEPSLTPVSLTFPIDTGGEEDAGFREGAGGIPRIGSEIVCGPLILSAVFRPVNGQHSFMRWNENDWVWEGDRWGMRQNEWLPGILQRNSSGWSVSHTNRVTQWVRNQCQFERAEFTEPFWLDGTNVESDVVACQNGTLWLKPAGDHELRPHDRRLFNTSVLPLAYDPAAVCPNWLGFLAQTFPGDEAIIRELQKAFGYLLERTAARQRMILLIGKKGSGKGVMSQVMSALVGDENVVSPTIEEVASNFGKEQLLGARLLLFSEITEGGGSGGSVTTKAIDNVKKLTGNDRLTVDRKHRSRLSFRFQGKVVAATNSMPSFSDHSQAMLRRIIPFRFLHGVALDQQNERLFPDYLAPELPGILNWAIAGWQALQAEGFDFSSAQMAEMRALASATDPIEDFCRECINLNPAALTDMGTIYLAYQSWVEEMGRGQMSQQKLQPMLLDRAERMDTVYRNGTTYIRGLELTPRGITRAQTRGFLAEEVQAEEL